MKFKGMKMIQEGHFIHRYDIEYEAADGSSKVYEMITRNRDMQTLEDLQNVNPDSVIMILTDENNEKLLLCKEYRMAMGQWVYNFPSGLIDPGATPEEAGARELREETGLELISIDEVLGNSYSAIGFSNEMNLCIFGKARGEFQESSSVLEEIQPGWYTRDQVREILKNDFFAARTQAFCYLWAKQS